MRRRRRMCLSVGGTRCSSPHKSSMDMLVHNSKVPQISWWYRIPSMPHDLLDILYHIMGSSTNEANSPSFDFIHIRDLSRSVCTAIRARSFLHMPQRRRTSSFMFRVQTRINRSKMESGSVKVTVIRGLSGSVQLHALCRKSSNCCTVRSLRAYIAKEAGITMWDFSLMRGRRLLKDRERFAPRCASLVRMTRQLAPGKCWHCTVQMVCHSTGNRRHITARKFPSDWLVNRGTDYNHERVAKLFGKFGPVVACEDQSETELRADEFFITEMIVGVEYLKAHDAAQAIMTLDGLDTRTEMEKAREPAPRVENIFSCRMKGSPVQYSACGQIKWVMSADEVRGGPIPPRYPPPGHLHPISLTAATLTRLTEGWRVLA